MVEPARTAAFTLDGFLDWERQQLHKHERVNGVVWMMAGGTDNHDRICNNLRTQLGVALGGKRCRTHGPDLKVVSPAGDVMYPDAYVSCGERGGTGDFRKDPVIVLEVLSDSTMERDMGRKRRSYQTIPSLRVLVYLSQKEVAAYVARRDDTGRWLPDDTIEGLSAAIGLPEIEVDLHMAHLYVDTDLADEAA